MKNPFGWFGKKEVQGQELQPGSAELKSYILSFVPGRNDINLLEAGASGGEDTIEWASRPEIAHVYAFEPVQRSFDSLSEKVSGMPKIHLFPLALSDAPGTTEINISSNTKNPAGLPSSSSILKPTGHLDFHGHIEFNEKQTVQLVTIDDWAAKNNVPKIDIMWLDMQGAEAKALSGGKKMLASTELVYSEVSLKPMYDGSMLYPEFKAFMKSLGFAVEKEFLYWEDMGNVLFRKKK